MHQEPSAGNCILSPGQGRADQVVVPVFYAPLRVIILSSSDHQYGGAVTRGRVTFRIAALPGKVRDDGRGEGPVAIGEFPLRNANISSKYVPGQILITLQAACPVDDACSWRCICC
jgi:hypothetical protein